MHTRSSSEVDRNVLQNGKTPNCIGAVIIVILVRCGAFLAFVLALPSALHPVALAVLNPYSPGGIQTLFNANVHSNPMAGAAGPSSLIV